MSIAESILPEFEQEMAGTRKTLERIPQDKLDWKAHPKSNTIGWVSAHLAEISGWVEGTLTQESWDLNPVGGEPYQSPAATSPRREPAENRPRKSEIGKRETGLESLLVWPEPLRSDLIGLAGGGEPVQ